LALFAGADKRTLLEIERRRLRVADWKFEFGGRLYWFEFFDKDFWKI
jgi:hypothetical protein